MNKYYKCNICGNVFKIESDSGVVPTCCGEDMEYYEDSSYCDSCK